MLSVLNDDLLEFTLEIKLALLLAKFLKLALVELTPLVAILLALPIELNVLTNPVVLVLALTILLPNFLTLLDKVFTDDVVLVCEATRLFKALLNCFTLEAICLKICTSVSNFLTTLNALPTRVMFVDNVVKALLETVEAESSLDNSVLNVLKLLANDENDLLLLDAACNFSIAVVAL